MINRHPHRPKYLPKTAKRKDAYFEYLKQMTHVAPMSSPVIMEDVFKADGCAIETTTVVMDRTRLNARHPNVIQSNNSNAPRSIV